MNIKLLIIEAKKIRDLDWRSPLVNKFSLSASRYLDQTYGIEHGKILTSTMRMGVIHHGNENINILHHTARCNRAIELLESYTEDEVGIPVEINKAVSIESLHPIIVDKCKLLYLNEHYAQAVEMGFKVVKDRLRTLTEYEGATDAFGRGKLYILGASAKNVDKDFQDACKFLLMSIDQFRNEKVHTSDSNVSDPIRAYEYLCLSSLAMSLLEKTRIASIVE